MRYLILLLCSIRAFAACATPPYANDYTYCREITIDHTKVPSTQTNFPVPVCLGSGAGANCSSNAKELATSAHGGRLLNVNGYDFIFTSDNAGTAPIAYERAYQDLTTGDAEMWVLISSLSSSADTKIYLFYRNSLITTDQSNANAVWDGNFLAVYHFPRSSGSYPTADILPNSLPDSTSGNRYMGVATGEAVSGTAGILGGGATLPTNSSFTLTSDVMNTNYTGLPANTQERMLEIWAFPSLSSVAQEAFCEGVNGNNNRYAIFFTSSNGWAIEGVNTSATFGGGTTAAWHQIVIGLPSGQTTFGGSIAYVDGSVQTVSSNTNGVATSLSDTFGRSFRIGNLCGLAAGYNFLGSLDEARISNIVRSADWVATEYNSISSPNTFYSLGTETGGGTGVGGPRQVIFR